MTLKGQVGSPKVEKFTVAPLENPSAEQLRLREAWLKGR
jgi:hypothetical protein